MLVIAKLACWSNVIQNLPCTTDLTGPHGWWYFVAHEKDPHIAPRRTDRRDRPAPRRRAPFSMDQTRRRATYPDRPSHRTEHRTGEPMSALEQPEPEDLEPTEP